MSKSFVRYVIGLGGLSVVFSSLVLANPKLSLYATNYSMYSNDASHPVAPQYEFDGAYKIYDPNNSIVQNQDMVDKINHADVVAYSFLQAWNVDQQKAEKQPIPSEWDGLLHFSDLWAEAPLNVGKWEWDPKTQRAEPVFPAQSEWFKTLCEDKHVGKATCSVYSNQDQKIHDYVTDSDNKVYSAKGNSFGAFFKSDKYGDVKRVIAIGGANTLENSSAGDHTFRAIFRNKDKFMKQIQYLREQLPNLAGLDLDFEPPIAADGSQVLPDTMTKLDYENLLDLVQGLRTAMPDMHIAVTITPNIDYLKAINQSVEGGWFAKMSEVADEINIMTYDFHGPWPSEKVTQLHTALVGDAKASAEEIHYGATEVVDTILGFAAGDIELKKQIAGKLQIAVAAYGRGYADVAIGANVATPGYQQVFSGLAKFGLEYAKADGVLPYKGVVEMLKSSDLDYHAYDLVASAPWQSSIVNGSAMYSASQKQFIAYESPESVKALVALIKAKGLKGAILWTLDQDQTIAGQGDDDCNPESLICTYAQAAHD